MSEKEKKHHKEAKEHESSINDANGTERSATEQFTTEQSATEQSQAEQSATEQSATEKSDAAKYEEEIERLTAQSAEYKDKWYRAAAEFENYKKRNAETRKNAYDDGKIDAIKKILFIGDNVERALSYEIDEKTKEGLNLLLRSYGETLAGLGLEVIDPVGQKFDPNFHEAVFTKPAEEGEETDIVDSVFVKGYKLGDRIIRYAQVVVIK